MHRGIKLQNQFFLISVNLWIYESVRISFPLRGFTDNEDNDEDDDEDDELFCDMVDWQKNRIK